MTKVFGCNGRAVTSQRTDFDLHQDVPGNEPLVLYLAEWKNTLTSQEAWTWASRRPFLSSGSIKCLTRGDRNSGFVMRWGYTHCNLASMFWCPWNARKGKGTPSPSVRWLDTAWRDVNSNTEYTSRKRCHALPEIRERSRKSLCLKQGSLSL